MRNLPRATIGSAGLRAECNQEMATWPPTALFRWGRSQVDSKSESFARQRSQRRAPCGEPFLICSCERPRPPPCRYVCLPPLRGLLKLQLRIHMGFVQFVGFWCIICEVELCMLAWKWKW